MNAQLLTELANQAMVGKPYPSDAFPPSPYYRFLKLLTSTFKPHISVELGVCGGGGCLYLADGHHDGLVYGVDVVNDYPLNLAYVKLHRANFHFIIGDSIEVGQQWNRGQVDILFIDTTHTYERTMNEYEAWKAHLVDGAIIILDDLYRDGMEQAFNEIPGTHVLLDKLHHESGFGAIIWQA